MKQKNHTFHSNSCGLLDRLAASVVSVFAASVLLTMPLDHLAHAAEPTAKGPSPIVITLKQFKVVKEANGETKLVDGTIVVPGDVLEYRAIYTNRGTVPLSVVASLPVPESVEYVKDSAKSKGNIPHTVA